MTSLRPLPDDMSFPELERGILSLWKERDVFARSVSQRPESSRYVFYDGPPFATGLPHYGHLVASTLKDIVPRYWTMRGHRVERRFGWDTHGLPVEMQIEKELGLSGPSSVRALGVDVFNETCRANVLKYTAEWERTITRLGRWVDFENDYKTMDPAFMETVWWVFRALWDRGLVYEDFRVMPYSWRLSTSLSNFEANLDYREVQDPALTVALRLLDDDAWLLIWTTTPWTLPSNLAVAVGADVAYVRARRPDDPRTYVIAEARVAAVLGAEATIEARLTGADLVGRRYAPMFPYFADRAASGAFVVIPASHVTTEDGTGLVHMAPDFGEEDFNACKAAGIGVVRSVDDEGRFGPAITDFVGRNVKEADPDIIRYLKSAGVVVRHDTITHSYPFCWRSGTPLIYRAVPGRFVRVTALRERMVAHNETIHWVPEAVGNKRFGNWLADARDWNVSRNRFWGTPIPIWRCEGCAEELCVGSIQELEERSGATVDDLHPHRIDHLTWPCAACGGVMRRISDVFDCWFESGAMPYAQVHYPFENESSFHDNFPAQFIAEGLDQTRGWFYTLLVLSTALFDKPPFRNVIVNGLVLAEDGSKMSKSKQNYPPPDEVLDQHGADALRAYLIDSPIVRAEPLRFSERGVREVVRNVLLPLRNAWSFFTTYARVDGWSPQSGLVGAAVPEVRDRPQLDRWILSVLQSLVADVNTNMEGYFLYKVVPHVVGFIDHLTNWYIRRSRRRFWRSADDPASRRDKASAYATLYEVLVTFAKILAPILPFTTEAIYQHLVVEPGCSAPDRDSVHLCDFPEVVASHIDPGLEAEVAAAREVVGLGRALRERHRLRTRQVLRRVTLVHADAAVRTALQSQAAIIADELNVQEVVVTDDESALAVPSFKANFKRLGARLGKRMKEVADAIGRLEPAAWSVLRSGAPYEVLGVEISAEDVLVSFAPKGDVVVETSGPLTVALDTEVDDALRALGLARELTREIQQLRKSSGLAVTDRIRVVLRTADPLLAAAIAQHGAVVAEEVLAVALGAGEPDGAVEVSVDGVGCWIGLTRADA